jgi:acyl-coenzyme A thioesterase PaaI-like protein
MADHTAPGARILAAWERLSPLPGGKRLFSLFLGQLAPYTGSMGARCEDLRPGHARWTLRDRRRVRNHLRSVHAIALVNLAEVASGTAMLTALPPGVRGIVTRIEIDYRKKARGLLTAESHPEVAPVPEPRDQQVEARVTDAEGDVVAVARVTWRLAPAEGSRA